MTTKGEITGKKGLGIKWIGCRHIKSYPDSWSRKGYSEFAVKIPEKSEGGST